MLSVLSLLLTLGLLIGVHEYGHYKMAVGLGVGVERFSFGFGPVLFKKTFVAAKPWGKSGSTRPTFETELVISALPLGGYVKFLDGTETKLPDHLSVLGFERQALWAKALIVLAGPLANLVLAFVLLMGMFMLGVNEPLALMDNPPQSSVAAQIGLLGGDRIERIRVPTKGLNEEVHTLQEFVEFFNEECLQAKTHCIFEVVRDDMVGSMARDELGEPIHQHSSESRVQLMWPAYEWQSVPPSLSDLGFTGPWSAPVIEQVQPNGPGQIAGLQAGDWIWAINGVPVRDAKSLRSLISQSGLNEPPSWLELSVLRRKGAQGLERFQLQVSPTRVFEQGRWVARLGVYLGGRPAQQEVQLGAYRALGKAWETSTYWSYKIGEAIWNLFTFQGSLKSLAGPITMAQSASESAHLGLTAFLAYLAMVSLNLGIFNLLPIPVLDGGHLLEYACQASLGRPLSKTLLSVLQRLGLIFILILTLLAIFNDLHRIFSW